LTLPEDAEVLTLMMSNRAKFTSSKITVSKEPVFIRWERQDGLNGTANVNEGW
jgi:hypothetical protein